MRADKLDILFSHHFPAVNRIQSVALIGISRKSGPGSFNLMEIMSDFGYSGEIYPVNPNSESIGQNIEILFRLNLFSIVPNGIFKNCLF
jgi:hypothetical protein